MEFAGALIVVGLIGAIGFTIVALVGAFRSDDEFYGESPRVRNDPPTPRDDGGNGD